MNIPIDFRSIVRLSTKLNQKFLPSNRPKDFPYSGYQYCVLDLLGLSVGKDRWDMRNMGAKYEALEAGFEGWDDLKDSYSRYYRVGQRLREYTLKTYVEE